jgi:hypothetical protein
MRHFAPVVTAMHQETAGAHRLRKLSASATQFFGGSGSILISPSCAFGEAVSIKSVSRSREGSSA